MHRNEIFRIASVKISLAQICSGLTYAQAIGIRPWHLAKMPLDRESKEPPVNSRHLWRSIATTFQFRKENKTAQRCDESKVALGHYEEQKTVEIEKKISVSAFLCPLKENLPRRQRSNTTKKNYESKEVKNSRSKRKKNEKTIDFQY